MDPNTDVAGASLPGSLLSFALGVLALVALWKIFVKAGEPGWAAIIPLYNTFTLVKIAGMNPWLFLLLYVPIVNIVIGIMVALKLGAAFGKSGAWSFFLLAVFSPIGEMILGFGSASYRRPVFV